MRDGPSDYLGASIQPQKSHEFCVAAVNRARGEQERMSQRDRVDTEPCARSREDLTFTLNEMKNHGRVLSKGA